MSDKDLNDHVSAGELRDHGIEISDTIPDCAVTPRRSVLYLYESISVEWRDDVIKVSMNLRFTEPFRWIEGTMRVEAKHEPTK